MKKIILRSSSPRRKELLEQANLTFDIIPSLVDETMDVKKSPYENVKELGLKKAIYEKEKYENAILIGCDTIVVLDGIIYGKPKDEKDAFRMLKTLSNRKHEVMSGVGIVYKNHIFNFVSTSFVEFKKLSDENILNYIQTKECFGKAGSYAIQGLGRNLVQRYSGSLENIIGLPIDEIQEVLQKINEMED